MQAAQLAALQSLAAISQQATASVSVSAAAAAALQQQTTASRKRALEDESSSHSQQQSASCSSSLDHNPLLLAAAAAVPISFRSLLYHLVFVRSQFAVRSSHSYALVSGLSLAQAGAVPCKRPAVDKSGVPVYANGAAAAAAGTAQIAQLPQATFNPYLIPGLHGYMPAVSCNGVPHIPPKARFIVPEHD
ncbi:unnamed protein product [Toxocara canis]|uniref:Secreted protein n=1 Tax=Toxocara canis TaxID=6265 RepID=A0A183U5F7_TOXCA|nr:unnamed protein product [Toxocara canis]